MHCFKKHCFYQKSQLFLNKNLLNDSSLHDLLIDCIFHIDFSHWNKRRFLNFTAEFYRMSYLATQIWFCTCVLSVLQYYSDVMRHLTDIITKFDCNVPLRGRRVGCTYQNSVALYYWNSNKFSSCCQSLITQL